jgi:WD40 repeat protein
MTKAHDVVHYTCRQIGMTLFSGAGARCVRRLAQLALCCGLGLIAVSTEANDIGVPYAQVGHLGLIHQVRFTPDGRFAVSAASDHTVRIWDVSNGREVSRIPARVAEYEGYELAVSSDARQLASIEDGAIRLWDTASGREMTSIPAKGVDGVVFTPDGRGVIAHSSRLNRLSLYDLKSCRLVRHFAGSACSNLLAISPDGRLLAVSPSQVYGEREVQVWDVVSGKVVCSLSIKPNEEQVRHLEFSRDNSTLLVNVPGTVIGDFVRPRIMLWDTASWNQKPVPAGLSNGRFGATTNIVVAEKRNNGHVVYDLDADQELAALPADNVKDFAVSPDGSLALFLSNGRTLTVYDLKSGREMRHFERTTVTPVALDISPDGQRLSVGYRNICIWDLTNATPKGCLDLNELLIQGLRFSPGVKMPDELKIDSGVGASFSAEGSRLLMINRIIGGDESNSEMRLFDMRSGMLMREFAAGEDTQFHFSAAALTADGRTALVGAFVDGSDRWSPPLALWDMDSGKIIRYFDRAAMKTYSDPVRTVAISPDGRFGLSSKDEDGLKLWDIANGKLLRTFTGDAFVVGRYLQVNSVVFSRDGKRAVAGYASGAVVLWSVEDGKMLRVFKGHTSEVSTVALSADGRSVYSSSADATVRIWDVETGRERAQLLLFSDGEWVVITPEGYFNASPQGSRHLNVKTGALSVTSVEAYYKSFYRPDAVSAALRGAAIAADLSTGSVKPSGVSR